MLYSTQICLGTYIDTHIYTHTYTLTHGQLTTIHMYTPVRTYIYACTHVELSPYNSITLKIHKMNDLGRLDVSSINSHTTKLYKYVDHYLQPLNKEVKSYINDTTNFLNKINIKIIPQYTILVTLDVRFLYFNINA